MLFIIFNIETSYFIFVPFLAYIPGMIIDFFGSIFITRFSKKFLWSRNFTNTPKKTGEIDFAKKDEALFIQNLARAALIISITGIACSFYSEYRFILQCILIVVFLISSLQFIRFEFYVKQNLYELKTNNSFWMTFFGLKQAVR